MTWSDNLVWILPPEQPGKHRFFDAFFRHTNVNWDLIFKHQKKKTMTIPEFSSAKEKEKFFHNLAEDQKIEALNEMIASSEHIVFLGGAGVSTESGIPDFRSKDGLYHKKDKRFGAYRPEYLLSYDCLHKKPAVFFDYFKRNLDCRTIEPNDAHRKLAEMESKP